MIPPIAHQGKPLGIVADEAPAFKSHQRALLEVWRSIGARE